LISPRPITAKIWSGWLLSCAIGTFLHAAAAPTRYHAYLWENRLGYDESTVLADLPDSLRTEVAVFLRRDFIERAPLFQGASHELVRDMALQLRPVVFTPGDFIFRAGQYGNNMYFISRVR